MHQNSTNANRCRINENSVLEADIINADGQGSSLGC